MTLAVAATAVAGRYRQFHHLSSARRRPNVLGVTATSTSLAFVIKLVAKSGLEGEVADFLTGALGLANDEAGTTVWFALRTDASTFWIVDAFPDEDARRAHINGPIAKALMTNADRLLAAPPEILPADVLAAKLPAPQVQR
jgi:quinol monooxygenase YgiN